MYLRRTIRKANRKSYRPNVKLTNSLSVSLRIFSKQRMQMIGLFISICMYIINTSIRSTLSSHPTQIVSQFLSNKTTNFHCRFLEELESDILEECCQCGKVKRVLSLDEKCGYAGCVAVTFYEKGNFHCVKINILTYLVLVTALLCNSM